MHSAAVDSMLISVKYSSRPGSKNTSVTDFCVWFDEIRRLVVNFYLSGYLID